MTWHPILEGDQLERARRDVRVIAEALRRPADEWVQGASLAGGQAGLALLFAYLTDDADGEAGEAAVHNLEQAIEAAASRPDTVDASLYGGISGVLWAAQHLMQVGLIDQDDELFPSVDAALNEALEPSWEGDYDLISGLVGFGVYFLERLPDAGAAAGLERVVDQLGRLAERGEAGITWKTPPEHLPAWQRELAPRGYYNLGLAHGVPGVIALLGRACAAGIAHRRAEPLLEGAVRWLLAQRLPPGGRSLFASWAGPGLLERDKGSRLAWCYGDLGLAAALLVAARCTGRTDWEQVVLEIARAAADRPQETAGARDTGLCHGTAGIAHLFNRIYQTTGAAPLRDAAVSWFARTLELRRDGEPVAGYPAWAPAAPGQEELGWAADGGLLTGAAGVGLALLAASEAVEPAWDRLLLISGERDGTQG